MDSGIDRAKVALSGQGLRTRIDSAEQRALNVQPKKKKKKPVPTAAATPAYRPAQKHVDARKAQIEAARAADRAAIAAMNKKNSLRRGD